MNEEDADEDFGEKTTFVICLRHKKRKHPCPILVTVRAEVRYGGNRPSRGDPIKEAFKRFTRRARKAVPLTKRKSVDVYIGAWGNQPSFTIPRALSRLIGKHRWSIHFTVDD